MSITFHKYQGTGNDFILIDNRSLSLSPTAQQVKKWCDRRFGIGADGMMLLNEKEGYDFEMVYYNADGREGSMCGNGGRCLVKFAHQSGILKEEYHFIATDGPHEALLHENGDISLKMNNVDNISSYQKDVTLNTGSPHYIQMAENVMELDAVAKGKSIRYNPDFSKEGINVNFVEQKSADHIFVRTYERGVEDETYSCGTGVTAAALAFKEHESGEHKIKTDTIGGALSVQFTKTKDGKFENIWLTGPATWVFAGELPNAEK